MKFKYLKIKNIASLEDATLDFEQKPLSTARLFLICGDTGSGKSTLLDAICLALYNKTPRLETGKGKGRERVYYGDDLITPFDPRHLIRHGATEASVELTFEGNDKSTYVAIWKARRTRNATLAPSEHLLFKNNKEVEKKEYDNTLQLAIGLNFDEFCRTTMLAQGQFTKFLKSEENSKAAILEKITNTSQFSVIGKTIYKLFSQAELNCRDAETKAENIQLFSEDERNLRKAQLLEHQKKEQAIRSIHNQTEKKIQWLETDLRNHNAVCVAEEQLKKIKTITESLSFQSIEKKLSDWDSTAEARHWKAQKTKFEQQLQCIAQEKEPHAQQIFSELVHARKAFLQNKEQDEKSLMEAENQHGKKAKHESMYDNVQTIVAKLEALDKNDLAQKENNLSLQALEKELPIVEQSLIANTKKAKQIEQDIENKKRELTHAKEELAKLQPEIIQEQRSLLETKQKYIQSTVESLNQLKLSKNSVAIKEIAVQETNLTIEKCVTQNKLNNDLLEDRKQSYENSKIAYDNACLSIGDEAERLRAQLKEGDTCPVCGEIIQKILSSESLKQLISPLQEDLQNKQKKLQETLTEIQASTKILNEAQSKLPLYKKQLQETQRDYSEKEENLRSCCQQLSITVTLNEDQDLSRLSDNLYALQSNIDLEKKNLEERQNLINKQNKSIQKLIEENNRLLESQSNISNAVLSVESAIQQKKAQILQLKDNVIQLEKSNKEQVEAINSLVTLPTWYDTWSTNRETFQEHLLSQAKEYHQLKEVIRNLDQKVKLADTLSSKLEYYQNEIQKKWSSWIISPQTSISIDNLEQRWEEFYQNANILHTKKETLKESLSTIELELRKFFDNHPDINDVRLAELMAFSDVELVKQEHAEQIRALQAAEGGLKQLFKVYEQHHTNNPPVFLPEENLTQLKQRSEEELQELSEHNQAVGRLDLELKNDSAARENHKQLLENIKQLREKKNQWATLNSCFGGSDGKNFRNIAQSYLLDNLLRAANVFLHDLNKRYQLECVPNSLIISLRDQYQPNVVSSVDTLSGGESFLVSLSLALALASLSKQSVSVDTLFIDEGFGTLSDNELNMVITLLERMQEKRGKRVGIISHVKDLRERIPVHVEVKRIDPTRSGIRVVNITE